MKQKELLKEIERILKRDTRGLTIQELSEKTNSSRITVSIALAKLEGRGLIDVRIVGNCRLNYLRMKK